MPATRLNQNLRTLLRLGVLKNPWSGQQFSNELLFPMHNRYAYNYYQKKAMVIDIVQSHAHLIYSVPLIASTSCAIFRDIKKLR